MARVANPKFRQPTITLLSHPSGTKEEYCRRRTILASPVAILFKASVVNAAETPAEAIRLLSSKSIPGLGPPDIYYPAYFVGKWRVTRVITTSDDDLLRGVDLPFKVVSEMRFVPYDVGKDFGGNDNPNNVPAIADRSFNEKSYHGELNRLFSALKSVPPIQTLNWTPTNPNVLSLAYTDGSSKEIKVTKRSTDVSKDGSGLFSSEFRRVTVVPASEGIVGGIPSIYKSRLLTKWKQGSEGTDTNGMVNFIDGIEIMYNEQGTLGEKDKASGVVRSIYGNDDTKDLPDWRSTKTKILMERI